MRGRDIFPGDFNLGAAAGPECFAGEKIVYGSLVSSKTFDGAVCGANVTDMERVEPKGIVFNKRDVSELSLHP